MISEKLSSFILMTFFYILPQTNFNIESGEVLFNNNCIVCHNNGSNLIIPEKNLKKDSLKSNGMYNLDSIEYQILNGKNGMPAFGGRLTNLEIKTISNYVLERSKTNFEE